MSDAKQRAQAGLADLVDEALKALGLSIKGSMVVARGSTRTSDARFVLTCVLEREESKQSAATERVAIVDAEQFRAAAARLSKAYQAKRAPEPQDDN